MNTGNVNDGAPVRRLRISVFCLGFLLSYAFFYWPFVLPGRQITAWLIPLCTFVAVPILDALVGEYRWNWTPAEVSWIKKQRWMQGLPLFAVPAFLFYQVLIFSYFVRAESILESVGWVLTIGIAGGVMGINIAHELIHRKSHWEQRAGGLLLVSVFYGSFKVEHIYGHHAKVATPEDMTTAPKGMTVYQFWWRALTKTPRVAWHISKIRAQKKGQRVHELVWLSLGSLAFASVYFVVFGWLGCLYWALQSLVAILLLETVNYIEHYGLLREKNPQGRYQPVTPMHSWNSSRLITNFLLFNLQRHADHHANASRSYPMLRHFDDSPQMPQGYATMILMSLVPVLWKTVMHPRLQS